MKCTIMVVLWLVVASVAFGDEAAMPAFSTTPATYTLQHEISASDKVIDEMKVGDITDSNLKFWFLFIRTNYHICSMSGVAKSSGNKAYEYSRGDCKLRITMEADKATVEDIGGKCSHSDIDDDNITSCGSRGYIGKTTLNLVSK